MYTPLVSIKVISGTEASDSRTVGLHAYIRLRVLPLDIVLSHGRPR